MNQVFSSLGRAVTIAVLTVAFVVLQMISPVVNAVQAATYDRNAEYPYGKVTDTDFDDDNGLVENARRNLKETAEEVREKLNLDQPVPQSTKDFFNSVRENVEETVEPVTGVEHGFFEENIRQNMEAVK